LGFGEAMRVRRKFARYRREAKKAMGSVAGKEAVEGGGWEKWIEWDFD